MVKDLVDDIEELGLFNAPMQSAKNRKKDRFVDGKHERHCYKCNEFKPVDQFGSTTYFSPATGVKHPRYQAKCKGCYARDYQAKKRRSK